MCICIITESSDSLPSPLINPFSLFSWENKWCRLSLTLRSSDVRNVSFVPVLLDCLLCFIRRFWNHTFTCLSVRSKAPAISIRRGRHKYLLKWNSFSNSSNWLFVYAVLNLRAAELSVGRDSLPLMSENDYIITILLILCTT